MVVFSIVTALHFDHRAQYHHHYRRQSEFYLVSKSIMSRMLASLSLATRIFALVLVIVAVVLILTAPGVCFWRYINGQRTSHEICSTTNALFPMNIDRWRDAIHFQYRGQNVWGQLAIIILALIFALPSPFLSAASLITGMRMTILHTVVSSVALVGYLVLGGVETCHMATFIQQLGNGAFSGCAGFPGCQTLFVVKGWAAAAALLFLCAVLSLIDIVISFANRNK